MYPLLVFVVCGAIIAFVTWRLRPSPGPWDIAPAPEPDDPADDRPTAVERDELEGWHRRFEPVVLDWIERHEDLLAAVGDSDGAGGEPPPEDRDDPMREAVAAHPAPVMRAELSAMQVAGSASIHAHRRGDAVTAQRQHLTYATYRDRWIDRLWQFPTDPERIRRLRTRLPQPEAAGNQQAVDPGPLPGATE